MNIGTEPWTGKWIENCFGKASRGAIANETILCGGNLFGRAGALLTLFDDVYALAHTRSLRCAGRNIHDQALVRTILTLLHNVIIISFA